MPPDFEAVLGGGASDLELGACVLAMRLKRKTPDVLCGFLDVAQAHGQPVASDWSAPALDDVITRLPLLPCSHDPATTAVYDPSLLDGE